MPGLPKGEVFLCSDTGQWPAAYEKERRKILGAIQPWAAAIHHIGSTAVPGLAAKPIIDMAVELVSFEAGYRCITPLQALGYRHRILPELPERHYFSKGEPRTHQIHMHPPHSRYLRDQLEFRDRLRSDRDLAQRYERLKAGLAQKFPHDKLAYTAAKTAFIQSVLSASTAL